MSRFTKRSPKSLKKFISHQDKTNNRATDTLWLHNQAQCRARALHARYHTDLHSALPRDQKAIILCRETFLTKIFFLLLLPKAAPNLSK